MSKNQIENNTIFLVLSFTCKTKSFVI